MMNFPCRGEALRQGCPTVREKVAVCCNEPAVAVTVTVDVVGAAPDVAPPLPGEGEAPHPVHKERAATVASSRSIRCRSRRLFLPTKHSIIPSVEPGNHRPKWRVDAEAAEVCTVRVEMILPPDTVAGANWHVAPLGRPEQVSVTAEVVEKPFAGVIVTVSVPLPPAVSVRDAGEAVSVKSGSGETAVAEATALA